MQNAILTFIGAGNMARSLIGGLEGYDPNQIWVTNPEPEKLRVLQSQFKIHTTQNNREGAEKADVIILAVKPPVLKTVATEIADVVRKNKPLVISIAAGVHEESLREWLGGEVRIVRCMPNTPALIRSGATALYANPWVTDDQKNLAESIMRAVGITVWLQEEKHLDIVTALSGSGPAYFFLIMEALEQAAQKLGLPGDCAHLLTLQTALGAAKMALENEESIVTLRKRVTSPGGTTERALQILEEGGLAKLFFDALEGAQKRAEELGKKFGEG